MSKGPTEKGGVCTTEEQAVCVNSPPPFPLLTLKMHEADDDEMESIKQLNAKPSTIELKKKTKVVAEDHATTN